MNDHGQPWVIKIKSLDGAKSCSTVVISDAISTTPRTADGSETFHAAQLTAFHFHPLALNDMKRNKRFRLKEQNSFVYCYVLWYSKYFTINDAQQQRQQQQSVVSSWFEYLKFFFCFVLLDSRTRVEKQGKRNELKNRMRASSSCSIVFCFSPPFKHRHHHYHTHARNRKTQNFSQTLFFSLLCLVFIF